MIAYIAENIVTSAAAASATSHVSSKAGLIRVSLLTNASLDEGVKVSAKSDSVVIRFGTLVPEKVCLLQSVIDFVDVDAPAGIGNVVGSRVPRRRHH